MRTSFIFGTPNHVHSMSPMLVNLFSRMQPLLKMKVFKDSEGKIIGGESQSLVSGKKGGNGCQPGRHVTFCLGTYPAGH